MTLPVRALTPEAPAGAAARVRLGLVSVTDFRNIARAEIAVPADGIAVVGDNGHGKTNLLEAIGYLQTLRSLRGARDRDLVRFGAEAFHVAASVDGATARMVAVGANRGGEKRVHVDGAEQPRLADALGAVPSVCFSPADVALVTAGPGERRRYLDIVLALTAPAYLAALRLFRAALSRRNAALRAGRLDRAAVRAWEPALATHGATIIAARGAWAQAFAARFAALVAAIGETQPMAMAHGSAVADAAHGLDEGTLAEALARALDASREQDVSRGMTQAGPHRDDLRLTLGGRDLRATGSAGQHRTAAIALRLLEGETFRARAGVQPIVLLDDPFAELDRTRAGRVLALLDDATHGGVGQVVLCVPRADEVPDAFTRLERWRVRDGAFARERGA
jgi:DNA replication and repair protein RecF